MIAIQPFRQSMIYVLAILVVGCTSNQSPENRGEPHEFDLPPVSSDKFLDVLLNEINLSLDSLLREEEEYQIYWVAKGLKEEGRLEEFVSAAWAFSHPEKDNLLTAIFDQWDEDKISFNQWKKEYKEKYRIEPPQFRQDTIILYDFFEMLLVGKEVSKPMADKLMKAKGYKSSDGSTIQSDDIKTACFSLILENTVELSDPVREEMKKVFETGAAMASNARSFNQGIALDLLDPSTERYREQVEKNRFDKVLRKVSVEEMDLDGKKYFLAVNYSDSSFKSVVFEQVVKLGVSNYEHQTDTAYASFSTLHPEVVKDEYYLEPGGRMKLLRIALEDTANISVKIELKGGTFRD